jgi:Kef-type K+ transport system membrane component KefB
MALSSEELAQLLASLALIIVSAHVFGQIFARLRQPRVIGEIVGGLILGPTFLLRVFPDVLGWVFPSSGPIPAVLGAIYQLGLLLLMYCSGAEIRSLFGRGERKTVLAITAGGILVPFLAGLLLVMAIGTSSLRGPQSNDASFALVFGIAIAVTSIPVISKILMDLGIIGTSFARIVLAAAVVEDILLYVALAVALGLAQSGSTGLFGLPALLQLSPDSPLNVAYRVIAEAGCLALALVGGPRVFRWSLTSRHNLLGRSSPIAFQLAFMLALSAACVALGVVPLFGAFVAGIIAGTTTTEVAIQARESIKRFSFAFFVPIYFALVGFQLDLLRGFDVGFFLWFLAFATAVKATSVYASARVAGETHAGGLNLAIAMNARGGPGIVLATVAFDAGIVSRSFFASLVMLVVVTSLFAGAWLEHVVRTGSPLRANERAEPAPDRPREPSDVTESLPGGRR